MNLIYFYDLWLNLFDKVKYKRVRNYKKNVRKDIYKSLQKKWEKD